MNNRIIRGTAAALILLLTCWPAISSHQQPSPNANQGLTLVDLRRLFMEPPDDSRIMMRWWWFGPSITTQELEREMKLMKDGGIGGFEVQPVYPLALDEELHGARTLRFLSDEFIDALRFTSEKANELRLRIDVTLGSGWPFGGPQVPASHSAAKLRLHRTKVAPGTKYVELPSLGDGEKLVGAFLGRVRGEQELISDSIREMRDIRGGRVHLPENLNGANEVDFVISSRTGQLVKRASVGGEGFVVNHLDRAATDDYLKTVAERLMQAFDHKPPFAIFCDSLEAYGNSWAPDFLEEFKKRRGYDLKPFLPALFGSIGPTSAAIRRDWGRTTTDLLNERFLSPLHEWAKRHNTLLRIQCYGVPAAALSSNAYADLPEGEGSEWRTLSSTRWASSASHIYGKPVTSSETWTWLHSPAFRATPLDMKVEADLHFLQGINQLIGHGWPYSAEGVEYPGWRFYAAGSFNEKNPWWIVMPDLARYLQRISFLLRQGKPATDVAIYLPNDDAWARFTAANVNLIDSLRNEIGRDLVARVLEAGYSFDFFDDDSFNQVGRIEKDSLVLGANKYKIVILPAVERIPVAILRRFEEFARAGGALIATRLIPSEEPGFQKTYSAQLTLRHLARDIFEGVSSPGHFVASERDLPSRLIEVLKPDVAFLPAVPDIGFVHRHLGTAEIYFLANTSNSRRKTEAVFRVARLQPEWWDPMTGNVRPAPVSSRTAQTISISLELEPYESRVLVFSRENQDSPASAAPTPRRSLDGKSLDLSVGWQVSFGNDAPITLERLQSWTELPERRYFSGLVTYEKSLSVSDDFLAPGIRVFLDFGEATPVVSQPRETRGIAASLASPIREAAVVIVNGRRVGSLWCPPWRIDLTGFLTPGNNTLRIVVGNTAINHMAGRALPDYKRLNLRYGERFQPQDMDKVQPISSGLIGRVRLLAIP